ncbi:MAG: flagellar motor protein MotB [Christensenellaceae bacterium]|nr:flagellar motor protein MotB [Christensenellaceae bacterium]MEA5066019.1 flagellar motor protein MotB [Eubacteriales bacterium]MEA5068488.1 flagellar motor protein MotB [Christensenellaceae bacterium]
MAKKTAPEIKIDSGRWLLTYADLMNNLLVFFIMLYVMSIADLSKFQKMMASFQTTFGTATKVEEVQTGNFTIDQLTLDEIDALIARGQPPSVNEKSGGGRKDAKDMGRDAADEGKGVTDDDKAGAAPTPTGSDDMTALDEGPDEYDELVQRISDRLRTYGYDKAVVIEKTGDEIFLMFREGVFFLPDQPVLKEEAYPILGHIAEILLESYSLIGSIDISGHTAKIARDMPTKENLFSWELSTNRALTVLKYLVRDCDMPQEKLSVSGYSCNRLYIEGDTEEYLAQNRRVEIRLTKASKPAKAARPAAGHAQPAAPRPVRTPHPSKAPKPEAPLPRS